MQVFIANNWLCQHVNHGALSNAYLSENRLAWYRGPELCFIDDFDAVFKRYAFEINADLRYCNQNDTWESFKKQEEILEKTVIDRNNHYFDEFVRQKYGSLQEPKSKTLEIIKKCHRPHSTANMPPKYQVIPMPKDIPSFGYIESLDGNTFKICCSDWGVQDTGKTWDFQYLSYRVKVRFGDHIPFQKQSGKYKIMNWRDINNYPDLWGKLLPVLSKPENHPIASNFWHLDKVIILES